MSERELSGIGAEDFNEEIARDSDLDAHTGNTANPHATTAGQVGAPTAAQFNLHTSDANNPHLVTAIQVGAPTLAQFNSHLVDYADPHEVKEPDGSIVVTGLVVEETSSTISSLTIDVDGNLTTIGNLDIGNMHISGNAEIVGNENEVQLAVRAANGQTANLQTWNAKDGSVIAQIQKNGRVYTSSGVRADALEGGASLVLFPHEGVVIDTDNSSNTADYDYTGGSSESLMTDTASPFASGDVGKWIIVRTGEYKGAMAEIDEYIDADNVVLHTLGWHFDISSFGYYIIDHPKLVIGDGNHIEFHCDTAGHFDIHSKDWIGNSYTRYLFEAELEAGIDGVDCALFEAEAKGYNQVQAIVADYQSGALQPGDTGGAVGARIAVTEAVAADATTEVDAYIAVIIDGSSATTCAYKVLPGFTNALNVQGADVEDPDYGYDIDNSTSTVTDRVNGVPQPGTSFLDASTSNVTLFADDDDYILIGSDSTFEIIEVVLATPSSKNIIPTFEYSTGDGTWATLTILADGTAGFTQSGQIAFNAPGGWAVGETAEGASDISSAYYVRIRRTYSPVVATPPVEDHFSTYASRAQGMLIRGDGSIKPVSLADVDAANDSVYYSTDQSKLVYKDSGGVVRVLY